MMQAWQREGGTSGWKFPDFCAVSGRLIQVQTQESVRQSQACRILSLPGWTCLVFHIQSLTRHGLWEVWPWHRCSPELQSTAAGFQSKDEPCCGRSARHRLRAATQEPVDPELNRSKGGLSRVAYTWVVPWIHMELVPWRKKGESQTGKALRHEVHWWFRCPINRWLENMESKGSENE